MSFMITAITEADVPALVQVDEDAYEGNPLRESISTWHTASPELRAQHLGWSAKMLRQWLPDEGTVFRKVNLESNGELVGWAAWKKPIFNTEDEGDGEQGKDEMELSPCLKATAAKEHMSLWYAMMEKHMGGRDPFWCQLFALCLQTVADRSMQTS